MAGVGPAPKPASQRARRNASVAMTTLHPRTGRVPKFPLGGDHKLEQDIFWARRAVSDAEDEADWQTTARDRAAARRRTDRAKKKLRDLESLKKFAGKTEREIWAALWKTPQATQWEKRGWLREVALYARHQAKAEAGSLDDSKEARQREDRLGLNDMAMLRLRWEIAGDDSGPSTGRKAPPPSSGSRQRRGHLEGLPTLQS